MVLIDMHVCARNLSSTQSSQTVQHEHIHMRHTFICHIYLIDIQLYVAACCTTVFEYYLQRITRSTVPESIAHVCMHTSGAD